MPKKLIAVLHLPALPGSPRSRVNLEEVWTHLAAEAELMKKAGLQQVIIENHGDAPFYPHANPPHVCAAMAVLAYRVRESFGLDVGLNILRNDGIGAFSAAAAAGGSFIRVNVLTGAAATDQGIIESEAHELLRLRQALANPVDIWADVQVKFATQLYQADLETVARATHQRGLADALIVTGGATGQATDLSHAERVRDAVPGCPVYVGSGVTASTVAHTLAVADGVIVGSDLKVDGYVENALSPERLDAFIEAFAQAS